MPLSALGTEVWTHLEDGQGNTDQTEVNGMSRSEGGTFSVLPGNSYVRTDDGTTPDSIEGFTSNGVKHFTFAAGVAVDDDQECIVAQNAEPNIGPRVRSGNSDVDDDYYFFYYNASTSGFVRKRVANTETTLATLTGGSWGSNGDEVLLRAHGTDLDFENTNGDTLTASDSAIASGVPGWQGTRVNANFYEITAYEGTGGGGISIPVVYHHRQRN